MNKIIDWHRSFVEKAQKQYGISNYALYWYGFLEGILVFWIVTKIGGLLVNKNADFLM